MEGWPFPSDFRDPSEAWDLQNKLMFFALYTGFWSCVVLAVFLYTRLRSRCSCCRRVRSPMKRQSNGFGDVLKMSEAFGDMPPFPESKARQKQAREWRDRRFIFAAKQCAGGVDPRRLAGRDRWAVAFQVMPHAERSRQARKRLVLEDSRAKVLISDANSQECKQLAADLGLHWVAISSFGNFTVTEAQRPAVQSGAVSGDTNDVAMLIYTSGSTGEPKGIVYDHQHLLHGAWFWAEEHGMSESSVQLFKSPYFWAVMEWEVFPALIRGWFWAEEHGMSESSVQLFKSPYFWAVMEWEVFPALIRGGKLVVASADGHKSPQYMAQTIEKFHVDVLMITPSVLDLLLDVAQGSLRGLRVITTVGEPLTSQLANRVAGHRGLSVTLRNFYGASESSCTVYTVPEHGVDTALYPRYVPAGTPQPHVSVFIMAEGSFELMPPGEAGEICFGGDAEMGCLLPVAKAAVCCADPPQLVAFVEPRKEAGQAARKVCAFAAPSCVSQATIRAHELMEHCRKELMPAYLPKLIVVLDAGLPVLPNGKVNYKSLKEMADKEASQAQETVMDSLGQM
eukprot:s7333_g4.t1